MHLSRSDVRIVRVTVRKFAVAKRTRDGNGKSARGFTFPSRFFLLTITRSTSKIKSLRNFFFRIRECFTDACSSLSFFFFFFSQVRSKFFDFEVTISRRFIFVLATSFHAYYSIRTRIESECGGKMSWSDTWFKRALFCHSAVLSWRYLEDRRQGWFFVALSHNYWILGGE